MPVPAQIAVKNASGASVNVNAPLDPGRAAATDSKPVVACTEDKAVFDSLATKLDSLITKLNASIAVTGTFWQTTQPVSGTVGISGTIPVSGTFWQATQPVSLASQPLPTGAATEASLAKLTIAQGATTSGQTGALIQGSVTTAAPTYTTGQVAPLSLDPSGQLRITGTVTTGGLNQGSTTSGQQGGLQMGAVTTAAPSYTTGQTSPLSLTTGGLLRVDPSTNANFGAQADTSATSDTGTFSFIALFKRALTYLSNISAAALDTTTPSPVKIDQTTPGTTDAVTVKTPADVISFTPTLDTAAYASGDVLFPTTSLGAVTRANDGRAVLMSLTGIDKSKNKPAFTLLFYQTNVTSAAANAANALSDADQANLLGYVRVAAADWIDYANNSIFCKTAINLLLEAVSGAQNVYVVGILDAGTPTFAASDLVLKLGVVQS